MSHQCLSVFITRLMYREPCCWWPIGHLRGWKGPSGFGAQSSWRDVLLGLPMELMRKKCILLTGATSGIGLETLRAFAHTGALIIVGTRNEHDANIMANQLMRETGAVIQVFPLDLGNLESVERFAEGIFKLDKEIDILVNNAGLMPCPFAGRDEAWHVNFIGHYALTKKLLPHMAPGARIINVSSEVYRFSYPGGVRFNAIDDANGYDAVKSYGQSKLALMLWTSHQSQAFRSDKRELQIFAVHPGSVKTQGAEDARSSSGWRGALLHCIGAPFVKSLEAGASTTVYCALHPTARSYNHFGLVYYANCNPRQLNRQANDPVLARRVCELADSFIASARNRSK
jgi:retinol dehydrogenase 12